MDREISVKSALATCTAGLVLFSLAQAAYCSTASNDSIQSTSEQSMNAGSSLPAGQAATVAGKTESAGALPTSTDTSGNPAAEETDNAKPGQRPALNVVIVEINNNVDKENYTSKLLENAFFAAGSRLSQYFHDEFGVNATVIDSTDQTTADALSHYLRDVFPSVADRSVTALFILSHGELEERADDPGFKNDLLIITSDTLKSDLPKKSLSFTRDLYPVLSNLHPGSVIMVFIDSCHSGGAANQMVSLDAVLRDQAGLKMLIMASSLSSEVEQEATFSNALVDLWTDTAASGACVTPKLGTLQLQAKIAKALNLEGVAVPPPPEVVVDYNGALCLDSLAQHKGLLFISNPTESDVLVTVSDPKRPTIDPSDDASPFTRPVKAHSTLAIRLNRDRTYILQVWSDDPNSQDLERIDMAKLKGLRVRRIGTGAAVDVPGATTAEANAYREASSLATALEIPESVRIKALDEKAEYLTNAVSNQQRAPN
jgi:Caspase domain